VSTIFRKHLAAGGASGNDFPLNVTVAGSSFKISGGGNQFGHAVLSRIKSCAILVNSCGSNRVGCHLECHTVSTSTKRGSYSLQRVPDFLFNISSICVQHMGTCETHVETTIHTCWRISPSHKDTLKLDIYREMAQYIVELKNSAGPPAHKMTPKGFFQHFSSDSTEAHIQHEINMRSTYGIKLYAY
jgi:hypothetical protein